MRLRNKKVNRVVTMLLTLVLCVGDMYVPELKVYAEGEKTVTGLGTEPITDPKEYEGFWNQEEGGQPWSGSYVYYGKYDSTPVKYRVLDKDSTEYGVDGGSMLLDCDRVLEKKRFDDNSADWADSELRAWLNSGEFLNSTAVFTAAERTAIASSTKSAKTAKDNDKGSGVFTPLSNDRVFLLDESEVTRIDYGCYYDDFYEGWDFYTGSVCHKKGADDYFWLRSKVELHSQYTGEPYTEIVTVGADGWTDSESWTVPVGVSPAFNVKPSSVIFSTLLNDLGYDPSDPFIMQDPYNPEYKLTLKDDGLSIGATVAKAAGNTYTVPYSITDNSSDAEPDRVSVVVTDGTWTDKGWSEGAKLLQYTKLDIDSFALSGTGTFTLDTDKVKGTWGTDYHVYLLAEDVRGEKESDLAGAPAEVSISDKDTHKVSFVLEYEAWNLPDQFVEDGGKATEPAAVKGIVIEGWYKEKGLNNKWDFANDTVTADITLYAKWTEAQKAHYTVSFDLNGMGEPVPKDQSVESGRKVTEPTAPTAEGYTFGGWYREKTCISKWGFDIDTVTGDMTLYAKWDKNPDTYTVSFDLNGVSGTAPEDQIVEEGRRAKSPTFPAVEGFAFGGWYKEKECTNRWDFDLDTVSANTILYAKWTVKAGYYTVSFNMNGVSGNAPGKLAVKDGEKVTEPTAPAADGYTFEGWYKEKECTNKWDFAGDTVTENITLYAKWTKKEGTYTVSFDLNGVSGNAPVSQNIAKGGKVTEPDKPTADGYTFEGWYKEKACTNKWDFTTDTVTEDITLYAKWIKIEDSCTVTFDLNGVSGNAPVSQNVAKGGKVTEPKAPTAEGYVFGGWYKEKACTNKWDFYKDTVSADTILYAKWTEKADPGPDITVSGNNPLDPVPEINDDTTELWLVKGQKFTLQGWSLDDQDRAKLKAYKKLISINKKGQVKVKNAGTAVIVKKDVSGNVVQSISANITKPELSNKKLKLEAGVDGKDTGSVALKNADNIEVYYYSAAPDVASVDEDGNVTALAKGSAKITAYANGMAYTATVSVKEPSAVAERTLHLATGGSKSVKLSGVKKTVWDYAEGTTDEEKEIVNIKKAKITGKKAGTVTLVAEGELHSYTMTVMVDDISITPVRVADKYDLKNTKGNKYKLVIAEGQNMTLELADVDQPVIFKSSNADVAVADVDGNVTARKKGKCKFTAKVDSKTISITVNVTQ